MPNFDLIALDADDTLWQNETLYRNCRDEFAALLAYAAPQEEIIHKLDEIDEGNIEYFGYGIKAYTLSLIDTAVALTNGKVSGKTVERIVDLAREMIDAPVQLLDGVAETLPLLAERSRLMLITKGDLLDQERKLSKSGLAQYFSEVEIISTKTRASYSQILQYRKLTPQRFMMVGNSLRSDVLPVLELGGHGVFIPFEITWLHETAEPPAPDTAGFHELKSIAELPDLLDQLG
jgi:putative hydrolase of the HAD superfamily